MGMTIKKYNNSVFFKIDILSFLYYLYLDSIIDVNLISIIIIQNIYKWYTN